MWTILWSANTDTDTPEGWDRFDDIEDVKALVHTLMGQNRLVGDDILIFPPLADDDAYDGNSIFGKLDEGEDEPEEE